MSTTLECSSDFIIIKLQEQQITGNKTQAVNVIKCTGQAWNVQWAMYNIQHTIIHKQQCRQLVTLTENFTDDKVQKLFL